MKHERNAMYNWKINIDRNNFLDVKVDASFSDVFNKEELKRIQNFYNKKNKKINFVEKVKIDDICYKNRTKLIVSWKSEQNTEKILGFIMFNPSFANPKNSDDTVRNAIRFAYKEGYSKIIIFNLFPIRISRADIICKYFTENFLKDYECKINFDDLPKNVVLCWGKLPQNIKGIDQIINNLCENLINQKKKLWQITNENFQRHLASPSINSVKKLDLGLYPVNRVYKFNK